MAENTRNEENLNNEDLRIKTTTTTYSNPARDTLRGNIKDVVAYVNKAREAQKIAAHDLEKANNWLNKSQELLAEVLAAIATGDASKETPSVNPDAGPDDEYLRMKRDTTSSNHAGVTVRGNKEDVVVCINEAKKAFAENNLEEAKKWLIKSQRIIPTVNAQDLLNEVLDAIDARDAPKETPSVNPDAGTDDDDTNSVVDLNPKTRTPTPTEPPSGRTVHNENIEAAKNCLDNANKAFKAGDFDKAERFLLKAKRMYSSIDFEQYLKHIHDARAKNTTWGGNAVSNQELRQSENPEQIKHQMDEANTYLQIAENALKDKNYDRALIFLDKSEALYTSGSSKKLREQVQDAKLKPKKSFVPSTPKRRPTAKEELDELIIAIRNDIDAGNLDEAERKLLTPGFVKCIPLKRLRTEVDEKKALRSIEDKPKIEEINPKPVDQTEPLRNEMLSDIHAEEADTCIDVAEKAYYDGHVEKAERLLKKAERLYPTERARKALETVCAAIKEKQRLDSEILKFNENESPVEQKVQKLINSGLDHMKEQNYYSAEVSFQKVKLLQPSFKFIDKLLTDVRTKIKNRNAI